MKIKNYLKKVIASSLVIASVATNAVYAERFYDLTYPGMDDVYRLDLENLYSNGVNENEDDANQIEFLLCKMGIMLRDDKGKFRPDAKLTKAEYEAAIRVIYSGEEVDFTYYENAYKGQSVYQKEIIARLLSFVESVEVDSETVDVEKYAEASGILEGIKYSGQGQMTRRDFATAVWNTLNCGYVEFTYSSNGFNATIDDDKTILEDKLGVCKIEGILNGIHGMNIYSTVSPNRGYIEIGRKKCNINGIEGLEEYLGYNVEGYAKYDKATEEYLLLNLQISSKDQTVFVNLEDFEDIDKNYLYYSDGDKYKKVDISSIERVLYNGDLASEVTEDMLNGNGNIVIGKSDRNGDYDIAVIKEYQNFYTKRYDSENKKLYLSFDAKLNNEGFVDLENEDANIIFILEGQKKSIDELKQNMSVSIIQNRTKSYTEIIANKKSITGKVTGIDDEKVIIEGEEFTIDPYYSEISKKSNDVPLILVGKQGKFSYTQDGVIVNFEPEGMTVFGMLRKVWLDEENEKVYIKMYTQSGEWVNYETVEKVEVDGVKVSGNEIVEKVKISLGEKNENSPTPVRYTLQNGKIKFIDTLNDTPEEENDSERMKECATFIGETEWRRGWDMGEIDYHVSSSVPMFIIPTDSDREQEYNIADGSAIPSGSNAMFTAYNPDKFLNARLAVMYGGKSVGGDWNFLYIKRVESRYDEKTDEVSEGVSCYLLTRGKEEIDEKFYKLPENWQEKFGIDNLEACFMGAKFDGDTINTLSNSSAPYVKQNKIVGDYGESFFYRPIPTSEWAAGTIVDIDVTNGYALIDMGDGGIKSVMISTHVIAKTDAKDSKHKAEGIGISELNPGDKIFYWGSLRCIYCALVIENY